MLLRSLGQNPTESELKNLIDEVDSDRSGSLEFDEFVDLMAATFKSKEEQEEEIRAAFLTFDADGSGFITREELIVTLTTMGDPIDEETINLMVPHTLCTCHLYRRIPPSTLLRSCLVMQALSPFFDVCLWWCSMPRLS